MEPMNEAREEHGLVVLGDKIFALGGKTEEGVIASVECLDLSVPNSSWTFMAPMNEARAYPGVEMVDGKILVVGGYFPRFDGGEEFGGDEEVELVRSIESFDPNDGPSGRWTVLKDSIPKFNLKAKISFA